MESVTIEQLLATLSLGANDDDDAESRLLRRLREVIGQEARATLLDPAVAVCDLDHAPRRRGIRAVVKTDSRTADVNVDALKFDDPTAAALVRCYRCWLGYGGGDTDVDVDVARRLGFDNSLARRSRQLGELIAQVSEELERLDYDEIEQWIGDDDPLGRHKQYWSDGAYRYQELVDMVGNVSGEIGDLAKAGAADRAVDLLEALLDALRVATFDYFCPDEVRVVAEPTLRLWVEFGPDVHPTSTVVEQLGAAVTDFGLSYSLARIVEDVPAALETPLLEWLEQDLAEADRWGAERLASIVCEIRLRRGEVDELLAGIPTNRLRSDDVTEIIERLWDDGEPRRALEFAEEWLAAQKPYDSTSSVEAARRRLLTELGRGEEAVENLWERFEANPSAALYREVCALEEADLERAAAIAARSPYVLVNLAASGTTHTPIANQITGVGWDELRGVSSWKLQDAAPHLAAEGHQEATLEVYLALGWRHVDRGKTDYYHLANEAFGNARKLCMVLGREAYWAEQAAAVVERHGRKYWFMPGFKPLMATD